ncbi:uncharacterized protein METZ01_LOCUS150216 [marine metagenome]|uniref:Uncharacterized protein n=1 Tax=marine metagenome TaxID=408172 RepID=A0A382A8E6_9ZZZZ
MDHCPIYLIVNFYQILVNKLRANVDYH